MSTDNTVPPPKPDTHIPLPKKKQKQNYTARTSRFTLNSNVVLSQKTRTQLDECLARLKFHEKIYEEWGFKEVDPMGRTAILNFYGPPGTGKTLSAEALAGTLEMPFLAVGTADLESKFMGETAKNIQAIFSEAGQQKALLFFDEADTLLGKRLSSVTQGVDNEVNAMRSTLLIELERYSGVVIFATNFAENYDEAFRSRIGYHVQFTLPDEQARRALWNRFLVKGIQICEDRGEMLDRLAQKSEGLSGREIRNCLRLALPKAMIQSEETKSAPFLRLEHLDEALQQIFESRDNVANPSHKKKVSPPSPADIAAIRQLTGKTVHKDESKLEEGE